MDTAQLAGAIISRNRLAIATTVTEQLLAMDTGQLAQAHVDEENLLQHVLDDLSRLFMAIVTHRPEFFRRYVEWQRTVFHHRDMPVAMIQQQLEVMERVVLSFMPHGQESWVLEVFTPAYEALQKIIAPEEPFLQEAAPHFALARDYLELLREGRARDAVQLVTDAVDAGVSVHDVYMHVIQPVQQEVGRLWQTNCMSVAEEHYATDATRTLMGELRTRFILSPHQEGDTPAKVLVACLGGELHDIGARMVHDFLSMAGFSTYFTGANTPHDQIIATINRTGAAVVALSATLTLQVRLALQLIDRIRQEIPRDVHVMVGGYAFNQDDSLWQEVGANAYARRADEAVEIVTRLLTEMEQQNA